MTRTRDRYSVPTGAAAFTLDRPWAEAAACGPDNAEWFFIAHGATTERFMSAANKKAMGLCRGCPVIRECYEHAANHPEPYARIAGGAIWKRQQRRERNS